MGLANLLKTGIQNKDWNSIIKAYEELTGDESFSQKPVVATQEIVKPSKPQENYIVSIRDNTKPKKIVYTDPDTGEEKNYGVKSAVNPEKIRAVGNLWNPAEYGEIEKDKDLGIVYPPKVKTTRKPTVMIDVVCKGCNRKFNIHPIYNRESGYMCDRCIKERMPG